MRDKHLSEIRINELNENDTVVLETENNVYRFRLKDRSHQMGTLEGGHVGSESEAVIGGMMKGDEFVDDRVTVGGRALFFSQMAANQALVKRIVTSPIARISLESEYGRNRAA